MLSTFKIEAPNQQFQNAILSKINNKTKPIGALGKLENIALQVALIQETLSPKITSPTLIVFAADHGIVAENVSPYPQDVTWQMVINFVNGGAAINIFTQQNGWQIEVVDAGVNHNFDENLPIKNLKVAYGTRNFLHYNAMDLAQLNQALQGGIEVVNQAFLNGCNTIAFGEMGIGNTSSAAVIMSKITGLPIALCTGKGTGLNDAGLQHKIDVLTKACNAHYTPTAQSILQTYGGFEIAMVTAAILQAAQNKMLILIDGFIITSALLVAHKIYPQVLDYCVFAHQSNENGHKATLDYLGVKPLLNLDMRLGEGTGAALALPIVQAAVNFLNNMASFEAAGVANK